VLLEAFDDGFSRLTRAQNGRARIWSVVMAATWADVMACAWPEVSEPICAVVSPFLI
jgi:uncharacterized protein YqjF (DUF2071 family)